MNAIEQGRGVLFADPDPDAARAFFRTKSRRAVNKVMELSDAVRRYVRDGDYLAIGGFGANRTPMAACHEIVRQGRKQIYHHILWPPLYFVAATGAFLGGASAG